MTTLMMVAVVPEKMMIVMKLPVLLRLLMTTMLY
jgi:hypothetical protein